jgi:cell filamentation protein, protein adenylyltransferase
MDIAAVENSPIGQLVPISGFDQRSGEEYEHQAFVPDLLPREVSLSSTTWTAVAQAEAALGRLDEASQQVPEPALLRQAALRREAQSTSALEGTFAPIEDVLEPELEERAQLSLEVWEILNYVVAAEEGFRWVADRPVTTGLICQLQRVLVTGTPGEHSDSGGIRNRQVVVGPRDAPILEARFVPPPPGDPLKAGVDQWVEWVADPPVDMPPVVRAAMAHYQFECLHPFSDGNGRIGRLLIGLELMRDGVLREPILVVSPWFEARRREYQDQLLQLSQRGNWDMWVRFFASGVAAAADAFRARVEALLEWRDRALETVRGAGVSGVAERVAGGLIGAPVLNASRVARSHDVTHQAAMNALRRLAELELLSEVPRGGRRSFRADRVIELLQFSFS